MGVRKMKPEDVEKLMRQKFYEFCEKTGRDNNEFALWVVWKTAFTEALIVAGVIPF